MSGSARVDRRVGYRPCQIGFPSRGRDTANRGAPAFAWRRCTMADTWHRAQRYRDLAEECRRVASSSSTEMRDRYLRMTEYYTRQADAAAAEGKDTSTPE